MEHTFKGEGLIEIPQYETHGPEQMDKFFLWETDPFFTESSSPKTEDDCLKADTDLSSCFDDKVCSVDTRDQSLTQKPDMAEATPANFIDKDLVVDLKKKVEIYKMILKSKRQVDPESNVQDQFEAPNHITFENIEFPDKNGAHQDDIHDVVSLKKREIPRNDDDEMETDDNLESTVESSVCKENFVLIESTSSSDNCSTFKNKVPSDACAAIANVLSSGDSSTLVNKLPSEASPLVANPVLSEVSPILTNALPPGPCSNITKTLPSPGCSILATAMPSDNCPTVGNAVAIENIPTLPNELSSRICSNMTNTLPSRSSSTLQSVLSTEALPIFQKHGIRRTINLSDIIAAKQKGLLKDNVTFLSNNIPDTDILTKIFKERNGFIVKLAEPSGLGGPLTAGFDNGISSLKRDTDHFPAKLPEACIFQNNQATLSNGSHHSPQLSNKTPRLKESPDKHVNSCISDLEINNLGYVLTQTQRGTMSKICAPENIASSCISRDITFQYQGRGAMTSVSNLNNASASSGTVDTVSLEMPSTSYTVDTQSEDERIKGKLRQKLKLKEKQNEQSFRFLPYNPNHQKFLPKGLKGFNEGNTEIN